MIWVLCLLDGEAEVAVEEGRESQLLLASFSRVSPDDGL